VAGADARRARSRQRIVDSVDLPSAAVEQPGGKATARALWLGDRIVQNSPVLRDALRSSMMRHMTDLLVGGEIFVKKYLS